MPAARRVWFMFTITRIAAYASVGVDKASRREQVVARTVRHESAVRVLVEGRIFSGLWPPPEFFFPWVAGSHVELTSIRGEVAEGDPRLIVVMDVHAVEPFAMASGKERPVRMSSPVRWCRQRPWRVSRMPIRAGSDCRIN